LEESDLESQIHLCVKLEPELLLCWLIPGACIYIYTKSSLEKTSVIWRHLVCKIKS
jgi:hypothetical protein